MPSSYLVPEGAADDALTRELLSQSGGSALRLLGGTLDTPGAAVRNLLALRNPFRGLFDLDERITGRELLTNYGLLGKNAPGFDPGDVAGFLLDVGLDPLTYASFGTNALTKSGEAARAAGLLPKGMAGRFKTAPLIKEAPSQPWWKWRPDVKGTWDEAKESVKSSFQNLKDEAAEAALKPQGPRVARRTMNLMDVSQGISDEARRGLESYAASQGIPLGQLAMSGESLAKDVSIDVPFLGNVGKFNLPTLGNVDIGKGVATGLDAAGQLLRQSRAGVQFARLFNKDTGAARLYPVQQAVENASEKTKQAAGRVAQQAFSLRRQFSDLGLSDEKYSRFVRGVMERVEPTVRSRSERLKSTGPVQLATAIEAQAKEAGLSPEATAKVRSLITPVMKAVDDINARKRSWGLDIHLTPEKEARYSHREATDPKYLASGQHERRAHTADDFGARTFVDVPGGTNAVNDVMSDRELHELVQDSFNPVDITAAPRQGQVDDLMEAGFEDVKDLTRQQATNMLKMVEQARKQGLSLPEYISRTQAPGRGWKAFTSGDAIGYVTQKYFGWDGDDIERFQHLMKMESKLKASISKLNKAGSETPDDIAGQVRMLEATLDSYKKDWKQAKLLAEANKARPIEQFDKPFFGNDPLQDWLRYVMDGEERVHNAGAIMKMLATSAQRLIPEGGGEFATPPEGTERILDALGNVLTGGKGGTWSAPAKSHALRKLAPMLESAGIIDKATLDRIVGKKAVYESDLEAIQQAVKDGADAEEIVHKYDGLMALNQIYVPKELSQDAKAFVEIVNKPSLVPGLFQAYDKFLNTLKAHLTVPFPGFHIRNAYNMMWQMVASGSYDPTRKGPMKYLSPIMDADKLMRSGDVLPGADKYFPGQKITDEAATAKLREIAAAHNTATGREAFHSETQDLLGQGRRPYVPDLKGRMPGYMDENPGALGLRYLYEGWKDVFRKTPTGSRNPLNVRGGWMQEGAKHFSPYEGGIKAASYIESVGRTATMMARMKQGMREDVAAALSNAAHIDYGSLTNWERQVAKRFIPFWSYASRAVPWTIRNLIERPGGLTAQTIKLFERAKGQGGFVPEQLQGSLSIPTTSDESGNQTFLTGFDLPFESINDYLRYGPDVTSTVGATLRAVGGQVSPPLQMLPELAFNRSLYQGRNLQGLDPALGRIWNNITGSDDPVGESGFIDHALAKSPASRYLSTIKVLTDRRDPIVQQAIKKPLQFGTGVRFKTLNMPKEESFAVLDEIKRQAEGAKPLISGSYVTVKKENEERLTDRQRQLLELYRGRSKALREQRKRDKP